MVERVKPDEIKTAKDGKVKITKEAFRNMLTHVLRFGNDALSFSVEVMGICMGKLDANKKDIVVINAVPITHGTNVEVGFSPEDYAAFAIVDEEYSEKGLFAVGWYHSHPGWGLFYSDTDIKNHLFYQKEQTPYAFGIVFDHTLMGKEGNLGFDVYRLEDYTRGPASNYIKVPYELEKPNSLDYFKWVQKFMEDSQKKEPVLIKEINEESYSSIESSDLQEIPIPDGLIPEEVKKDEFPKITPIVSGFDGGIKQLNDTFSNIFKTQLGTWSDDVNQGASKGIKLIQKTLNQMSEAISFGFSKVKTWFEKNLDQTVDEFKTDITEYINTRMQAQKELAKGVPQTGEDIVTSLQDTIKQNITKISELLSGKFTEMKGLIETASTSGTKMSDLITKSSERISSIANEITSVSADISKDIDTKIGPFEENVNAEIQKITSDLTSVKDSFGKMKEMFEKLQKSVMGLRNL